MPRRSSRPTEQDRSNYRLVVVDTVVFFSDGSLCSAGGRKEFVVAHALVNVESYKRTKVPPTRLKCAITKRPMKTSSGRIIQKRILLQVDSVGSVMFEICQAPNGRVLAWWVVATLGFPFSAESLARNARKGERATDTFPPSFRVPEHRELLFSRLQ